MQQTVRKIDLQFSFSNSTIQVGQISYGVIHQPIPLHSHGISCYEIHYILEGFGELYSHGNRYPITPNTLYITGPNIEHAQSSNQDSPMKECCIYLIIQNHGTSELMKKFLTTSFWFGDDTEGVKDTLAILIQEVDTQKTGYKEQIQALISQLIIQLIRNYEQSFHHKPKLTDQYSLERTTVTIEHYFLYEYTNLTLEGLATKLNLSTRQTQRLLKNNYEKTFQEKKAEAKMAVAEILLKEDKTIHEISELLSYSSPEHFSMAFKKYYGMSPREYRK